MAEQELPKLLTGVRFSSPAPSFQWVSGASALRNNGRKSSLRLRDFELLRQDRRRARAAYPDVDPEHLIANGWFNVDFEAKVPAKFGGWNCHSRQGDNNEWYLDGGCYLGFVRSEYSNRADAETTSRFFLDLAQKKRAEKLEKLRENGPFTCCGGSGGQMRVHLDKDAGQVVVVYAGAWKEKGTEWRIPFIAEEWVDIEASNLEEIKRIPSFTRAVESQIPVTPYGVRWAV